MDSYKPHFQKPMNKSAVLCLFVLLLTSCRTNKSKPNFPSDIRDMCILAKQNAQSCIHGIGSELKSEPSVQVTKHKAEKNINGMWCWYDTSLNMYVGGITWKSGNSVRIEVASNPNDGSVDPRVVTHEFGHYWLISNGGIYHHDSRFRKCFHNWFNPKMIRTLYLQTQDDIEFIVDVVVQENDQKSETKQTMKSLSETRRFKTIIFLD